MDDHPNDVKWRKAIDRCMTWACSFQGTLYRVCDPGYGNARDLLTGEGAHRYGGRWNSPSTFPVVYLAMSLEGAIAEIMGVTSGYAFDVAARLPLMLVAVDVVLDEVLDLGDRRVRKALGVTLSAMKDCPWRLENAAGREAMTQALGRAAHSAGLQGIMVQSAVKRTFHDLNVFPRNLDDRGSMKILQAQRLPPPPPTGMI